MLSKFREVREQKHIRSAKKAFGKKLIQSAAKGDLDKVLKIIADCHGDPDVINYAPLLAAIGQPKLFDTIEQRHSTALEIAARNGHLGVVSALLKVRGIDLNARSCDFHMNTPLLSAVTFGHVKIAEALAEAGSNPNLLSQTGETALTTAFLSCPDAVPAILKIPTLKINEVNRAKCSALHYAVRHRADGANYVDKLIAIPGILIDLQDVEGYTPLMMAAKKGALKSIELLIQAGADVTKKNSSGLNAKEIAVLFRHPEAVDLLEKHEQSLSQEPSITRNQP